MPPRPARPLLPLLIPFTLLTVTACMNASTATNGDTPPPADPLAAIAVESLPAIEPKENPRPVRRYALSVRFDQLPRGPLALRADANYAVEDVTCVPPLAPSGARPRPEHAMPVALRQGDVGQYIGELAADALADEDYFDLGVCRWSLQGANVRFESPTTAFVAYLPADRLAAGEPLTLYFLASDFEKRPDAGDVVFGEPEDIFAADAGPRFTVTLSADGVTP